jgi:hypothetical protein
MGARLAGVFLVRGTKKFLDRVGGPTCREDEVSTTSLGDWYVKRAGVMNEFAYLADLHHAAGHEDLVGLSVFLSETRCSPLYGRHVSPDRELAAHAARRGA